MFEKNCVHSCVLHVSMKMVTVHQVGTICSLTLLDSPKYKAELQTSFGKPSELLGNPDMSQTIPYF